jgi:hypothetical protein
MKITGQPLTKRPTPKKFYDSIYNHLKNGD